MNNNKIVGNFGENLACEYLKKKGYRIIERNFQAGHQEIDIIADISGTLVFVEVKTRTFAVYGEAEEAICQRKTDLVKMAINYYLAVKHIRHDNIRLDYLAIDVIKSKKIAKIKHFEDLF